MQEDATPAQAQHYERAVAARYNGVAVWLSTEQPRQLLRNVTQQEVLAVLEERADGWLRVRLPEGAEGYIRRDVVRDTDARPGAAAGTRSPAGAAHLGLLGDNAFPGAPRVAAGLTVFAWITLVLSQIIGIAAASSYNSCTSGNSFFQSSSCGNDTAAKLVLYVAIATYGLFMALYMWAAAYAVLLLDRIERNTSRG